jgi:hypothetical protein
MWGTAGRSIQHFGRLETLMSTAESGSSSGNDAVAVAKDLIGVAAGGGDQSDISVRSHANCQRRWRRPLLQNFPRY